MLLFDGEINLQMICFSQDRRNDDAQTPAQRQAAAKLALRKQLEKTLLQVRIWILSSFKTVALP